MALDICAALKTVSKGLEKSVCLAWQMIKGFE
jgi:hypothetical protein